MTVFCSFALLSSNSFNSHNSYIVSTHFASQIIWKDREMIVYIFKCGVFAVIVVAFPLAQSLFLQ